MMTNRSFDQLRYDRLTPLEEPFVEGPTYSSMTLTGHYASDHKL